MRFIVILFSCTGIAFGAEKPILEQVSNLVTKLASDSGFSDSDATEVAIFFFKDIQGPPFKDSKLATRIQISEPESVTVFVCYDYGPKFTGYDFTFKRGNITEGMRWAHFWSLQRIPSK